VGFFSFSFSQNLIPNPSFEEHHNGDLSFWNHPSGKHYHYYIDDSPVAYEGQSTTCLCFHKDTTNGSEYLSTRLERPLERGKNYKLSMMIKLYAERRPDEHFSGENYLRNLGWRFDSMDQDFSSRMRLRKPDALFELPNMKTTSSWVIVKSYYKAKGDEEELVIGYFYGNDSLRRIKHFNTLDSIDLKRKNELIKCQKEHETRIRKLKNELNDYIDKRGNKNRLKKENLERLIASVAMHEKVEKGKINNHFHWKKATELVRFKGEDFKVRMCFDQISLQPIPLKKLTLEILEKNVISVKDNYRLDDVHFEFSSYKLMDQSSISFLTELGKYLVKNKSIKLNLIGHTDTVGSAERNNKLSLKRAFEIQQFLVKYGIESSRITFSGKGERVPLVSNETAQGRAENRRVEVFFFK